MKISACRGRVLVMGLALAAGAAVASATTIVNFQGSSGIWDNAANWSPARVPGAAGNTTDMAIVGASAGQNVTLNDDVTSSTSPANFWVNNGSTLNVVSGANIVFTQKGAVVGQGGEGLGTLDVSGGTLGVNNLEMVNQQNCSGVVNQTGGTINLTGGDGVDMIDGSSKGTDSATWNMSGSSVVTTTTLQVGVDGKGTFNQSGGTLSYSATSYLSQQTTGNGTYNLSGGTFQQGTGPGSPAPSTSHPIYIGQAGTGQFNQTGGAVNVGEIVLNDGENNTSAASGGYTISGGSLTTLKLAVGGGITGFTVNGTGTFTVTGSGASQIQVTANSAGAFEVYKTVSGPNTSQGTLAMAVDSGGVTEIVLNGGSSATAVFETGSLLNMSWVPGTSAAANTIYNLLQAHTISDGVSNANISLTGPDASAFEILPLVTTGSGPTQQQTLEAELLISVPEPTTLGLLGGAGLMLLRRRKLARA